MPKTFPHDFLFGAATSAHQVEGGNTHNDWWAWEHSSARHQALRRLGRHPEAYESGKACDHFHRFEEDFDLAKALHHNAHRFSIEWSRIEPKENEWDRSAIDHYREVLLALRAREVIPLVTIHHFTNPRWFSERGGWVRRDAPTIFARYVARIAEDLGDLVPYWITINEPSAYVAQGYLVGEWPPCERNPLRAFIVIEHLAQAHKMSFAILRGRTRARIGIAYSFRAWFPLRATPSDQALEPLAERLTWRWFLDKIRNELDFIGVNYYFANRVGIRFGKPVLRGCGATLRSDMGWDICPNGLERVLTHVSRAYGKPLIVTENGLADADDSRRARFIFDHLNAVRRAMDNGADVRGYLHWSLLDNFEWAEGFAPRFGLVAVNYATMERQPRKSALYYGEMCRTRSLPDDS
jgi:beta-glucosidase